jgi:hypothetical protein
MRYLTGLLAVLLAAGLPLCAPAATFAPGPAPADEYFGPHHQSILEIRNRLQSFDRKSDAQMLHPGVVTELDDIAYSIGDWHHQYPNDPWLPHAYAELLYCYHRAGALSTPHARVALDEMRSSYPDAPETSETIAMIYGDAYTGAPQISLFAAGSVAPPPPVAIPARRAASSAWARFDAMRAGVGQR